MTISKFFKAKPASEITPGDWLGVMACLGFLGGMALATLATGVAQAGVVLGWVAHDEPTLATSALSIAISLSATVFFAWLVHHQMAKATARLTVVDQEQRDAG